MNKILRAGDFIAADHPDFFVDALRIHDEFNNTNKAEIAEAIITTIDRGADQVKVYIKLVPAKAEDAVAHHNEEVGKLIASLVTQCGLKVCRECNLIFFSEFSKHEFCSLCWEETR